MTSHMDYDFDDTKPDYFSLSVMDIGLELVVTNLLKKKKVYTVDDLCGCTRSAIMGDGMGPGKMKALEAAMEQCGALFLDDLDKPEIVNTRLAAGEKYYAAFLQKQDTPEHRAQQRFNTRIELSNFDYTTRHPVSKDIPSPYDERSYKELKQKNMIPDAGHIIYDESFDLMDDITVEQLFSAEGEQVLREHFGIFNNVKSDTAKHTIFKRTRNELLGKPLTDGQEHTTDNAILSKEDSLLSLYNHPKKTFTDKGISAFSTNFLSKIVEAVGGTMGNEPPSVESRRRRIEFYTLWNDLNPE